MIAERTPPASSFRTPPRILSRNLPLRQAKGFPAAGCSGLLGLVTGAHHPLPQAGWAVRRRRSVGGGAYPRDAGPRGGRDQAGAGAASVVGIGTSW
jgi:hypothetical protein